MKQQENPLIRFFYGTTLGRICLKPFITRKFSRFMGRLLNSGISRLLIPSFIRRSNINMKDYEQRSYESFNDFFTRRLQANARPIDYTPKHLISPCDGKLLAYNITPNAAFTVKHIKYSLADLLDNKELAAGFAGGVCLVFRLTPAHYHRYIFIDNGQIIDNIYIDGGFHCVRPMALAKTAVFISNCREYALMSTENFGCLVQMEVGAMSVGKINNHKTANPVRRGCEKGHFEFGGSTIIILLKKDSVRLNSAIITASACGQEYPVQVGQKIGESIMQKASREKEQI